MSIAYLQRFSKLNNDEKLMVIQIGMEAICRIWLLNSAGLSTLGGACYYIHPCGIVDVTLHALNGDVAARELVASFCENERVCKIVQALSLTENHFKCQAQAGESNDHRRTH